MNYTEASSDFQESMCILRQIALQGSVLELWNRSPQGKPILLRMQSMLPQFKITSEVLKQLWGISTSDKIKGSGVCTAYKYSPAHFLSLKVTEVHFSTRGQAIPPADYLLYLVPQPASSCPERLKSDEKTYEKMMKSIQRHVVREQFIEPLDICRTLVLFGAETSTQKLQIKCEILYAAVSLQFTPISSLKLVSTPLSVKLTQNKRDKFQAGYLTMDQSGRVLPLLPSDPLSYKYPIVGIWVTGIPESQNSKACPIMHPLVWANCVQFIENANIKDKISPCLEENSFLFLHFASKPKFYEASTTENPCWKTAKYCTEILREDSYFSPCFATFVREDQSNSSLEISINLPRAMNTFYTPSGSFQPHVPSTNSKPPRQSISPSNVVSNRSSDSFKKFYSPHAEKIISEQSKVLAQLQAQILELQAHVFNSTPKNKKHISIGTVPSSFTPNRMSMHMSGTEKNLINPDTSYRELFQEQSRLKKSISTEIKHSKIMKASPEVLTEKFQETPKIKNPLSNSSDSGALMNERTVKPAMEKKDHKIVYNPLRYSNTSPEPSPQPYQSKPKTQTESDSTIYVPKIQYDTGSDSSGEDEKVEAVERKYLYQN